MLPESHSFGNLNLSHRNCYVKSTVSTSTCFVIVPFNLPQLSCGKFIDPRTLYRPASAGDETPIKSCHTDSIAGLVEFNLLQRLLSHLEHRGPRLAVHIHLQGRVRDPSARKQISIHLRGVRHLGNHARVHSQLLHPLLLSNYADSFRWLWLCSPIRFEVNWKCIHLVQPELRQWNIGQFVLYGVFCQGQLPFGSGRFLGSLYSENLGMFF